ncbi:hypothetical protein B0H34DRAFT_685819 [Crassisporium funariophilum]|nr:hypothetical protein B0H34DRAFT_685819 [Crassisporium funariophilum]
MNTADPSISRASVVMDPANVFIQVLVTQLNRVYSTSPRRYRLVFLLTGLAAVIVLFLISERTGRSIRTMLAPLQHYVERPHISDSFGAIDKIFVISLPRRSERRKEMERLRLKLGLEWLYVDALDANTTLVGEIMDCVRAIRSEIPAVLTNEDPPIVASEFKWPDDIEELSQSGKSLDLWTSGIWATSTGITDAATYHPISSAIKDYSISGNISGLPQHLLLTPPRIACWYSHLTVIHDIANGISSDGSGASLILEDDIDMENDIHKQIRNLWRYLPEDWDIVFLGARSCAVPNFSLYLYLGHCWSDEAHNPPLSPEISPTGADNEGSSSSRLYASRSPKCTHAYALSKIGARRLLLHLRYPPFAFSRAIDQAFSWLVESGRLKSFSVVPSLVVQRKIAESDVMEGKGTGSKWKDRLTHGVLEGDIANEYRN